MLRATLRLRSALSMPSKPPLKPLIAVIGATGTGKSQLAVDLATRFDGEIINGDAMQLYDGLPIITNKMSLEERKSVPHHLLGCIKLDEQPWTVDVFVPEALKVIEEIRSRGRLPILVGGTHYYTQALLFRDALVKGGETSHEEHAPETDAAARWPILEGPTEIMHAKLREVDPAMANKWHPSDRRKIRRSLEIWLSTGKTATEIYEEQRQGREDGQMPDLSGSSLAIDAEEGREKQLAGMRYPTLILWVHAEKEILADRLKKRVKRMTDDGLLAEAQSVFEFLRSEQAKGNNIDQGRGIWVSIGYKEFVEYLKACQDAPDAGSQTGLLDQGIERTEIHTRQYANYQVKWIRNKLLEALQDAGTKQTTFLLDASDLTAWEASVLNPAADLVSKFLDGVELPNPKSISEIAPKMLEPRSNHETRHLREPWSQRRCEICGTTLVTVDEWDRHIKSRRHGKMVKAEKKRKRQAENGVRESYDYG